MRKVGYFDNSSGFFNFSIFHLLNGGSKFFTLLSSLFT
jgi:hypothetical protein